MDKKSVIISLIPQRFRLNTSYDLCCHKTTDNKHFVVYGSNSNRRKHKTFDKWRHFTHVDTLQYQLFLLY